MNNLQAMYDGMSKQWQKERSESQMTLGRLITALRQLSPLTKVRGLGELQSYRGYYSDLAFSPVVDVYEPDPERPGLRRRVRTEVPELEAHAVLSVCEAAMGRIFEGYKGGDFMMGESTPLWVSNWGESSCDRLMSLAIDAETGICGPVTSPEFDD